MDPVKPGDSMIRSMLAILTANGVVVLPSNWDHEHVSEKSNEWLKSAMMGVELVSHHSLGPEGLVGSKVYALRLIGSKTLPQRPLRGDGEKK